MAIRPSCLPNASGCALAAIVFSLSGCSRAEQVVLAAVTGRVTLDGRPVANAWVRFQPQEGRASEGRTDNKGVYALEYTAGRRGALLGGHRVQVGTYEAQDAFGNPVERPELIPPRYNSKSALYATVTGGENVVDLELTLETGERISSTSPAPQSNH